MNNPTPIKFFTKVDFTPEEVIAKNRALEKTMLLNGDLENCTFLRDLNAAATLLNLNNQPLTLADLVMIVNKAYEWLQITFTIQEIELLLKSRFQDHASIASYQYALDRIATTEQDPAGNPISHYTLTVNANQLGFVMDFVALTPIAA